MLHSTQVEEVTPDKSSQAAGQVFEPDRPYESLHVPGWRLKTMALVTDLKAATEPDLPSRPVWGRKLPSGFDSRPPPRGEIGEPGGHLDPSPLPCEPSTGTSNGPNVLYLEAAL
jgi:hypothetical protein